MHYVREFHRLTDSPGYSGQEPIAASVEEFNCLVGARELLERDDGTKDLFRPPGVVRVMLGYHRWSVEELGELSPRIDLRPYLCRRLQGPVKDTARISGTSVIPAPTSLPPGRSWSTRWGRPASSTVRMIMHPPATVVRGSGLRIAAAQR